VGGKKIYLFDMQPESRITRGDGKQILKKKARKKRKVIIISQHGKLNQTEEGVVGGGVMGGEN